MVWQERHHAIVHQQHWLADLMPAFLPLSSQSGRVLWLAGKMNILRHSFFFFFLFHFDYTQHSTLNTMKQLQRGFPKPWTFLITYWRTALTHSPYRLRLQSKTNTVYFSLVSIFSCILQTLVKSSLLGNWDIFRVKVAVEILWMHVWREYTKGGWKGWRRNWFLRINQKLEKYQHFWDAGMKTGGDDDAQGFCRN